MSGSGFLKVFSGFLIAFALVAGLGFFASQVLIAQFTTPPPKPVFPKTTLSRNRLLRLPPVRLPPNPPRLIPVPVLRFLHPLRPAAIKHELF
ncbi:MAG: hypothetical protein ACP5RH_12065 [Leptodesmis sp.]|uniref:hypothetical protein n=1 Tax=Leptodesmis sp. TaxID=3100501 RepID=UPI003D10F5C5